jgi:hypothetical protein
MTVRELIKYLLTLDQDMIVAHRMFSEQCELNIDEIAVVDLCYPRSDGWIQNARPDMPTRKYLLLPGN